MRINQTVNGPVPLLRSDGSCRGNLHAWIDEEAGHDLAMSGFGRIDNLEPGYFVLVHVGCGQGIQP